MRRGLAIVLMGSWTFAVVAQSSRPAYADESKDAFATLRQQWARNLHDKHVDASIAEYTTDAEFINPDGSRVSGTAGLRQLFETVTAMFDSDLVFDSRRVELSGDLAYDSGTYQESLTARATGKVQKASGSYLIVYRRKDGAWLIEQQIWTGAVTDAAPVPKQDSPSN